MNPWTDHASDMTLTITKKNTLRRKKYHEKFEIKKKTQALLKVINWLWFTIASLITVYFSFSIFFYQNLPFLNLVSSRQVRLY